MLCYHKHEKLRKAIFIVKQMIIQNTKFLLLNSDQAFVYVVISYQTLNIVISLLY